jgi:small-conductance mechanosensitive channel
MKKAVLWMIAGIMILGSLKTFAADVTAGKLDAVAQDSLENDIQADITEGKIQAAMLDSALQDIQLQINQIYRMQDEVGMMTSESTEEAVSSSHQVIKELGWEADLQSQKLERISQALDLKQAEEMKKDMVIVLKNLKKHADEELRGLSN